MIFLLKLISLFIISVLTLSSTAVAEMMSDDSTRIDEDVAAASISAKQMWPIDAVQSFFSVGYADMYKSLPIAIGLSKNWGTRFKTTCYLEMHLTTLTTLPIGTLWSTTLHINGQYLVFPGRTFKLYGLGGIGVNQLNDVKDRSVYVFENSQVINERSIESRIAPGLDVGVGVGIVDKLSVEVRALVTSFSSVSINVVF